MQYIDIDSTYRNRSEFPLQAEFNVLTNARSSCGFNKPVDGVSAQTVLFPPPQTNPPMAYFSETLQQVYGSMVMKPNLPLMYRTNTETIVQLDELVLSSVDPSTRNYIQNSMYPRGVVPLEIADEAYAEKILEDVDTGEFRNITYFSYDITVNAVFQTGTVLSTALFGTEYHVYTSVLTPTQYPMSNIERAYQGKYLMMISGTATGNSKLIVDYIPGINENDFKLAAPLAGINTGDVFQIVSNFRWFATIDRPFSTPLPFYPSYRDPIPNVAIQFFQNVIYMEAPASISYCTLTLQAPIGIGIGIVIANGTEESGTNYPLANMMYITSADNAGKAWNEPVAATNNIYLNRISAVSIFGSSTNPQGYGSTPTLTYAIPSQSSQGAVFQQFSDDSNGQFGWQLNGGTDLAALDTALQYGTVPDKSSLIHAVGDDSNVYASSAYTNYASDTPTLYFTYFDKFVTNAWITVPIDTDISGNTIQLYALINLKTTSRYGLLYRKETSMEYAFVDINTTTGVASTSYYSLGTVYDMPVDLFFMTNALDMNLGTILTNNGATTSLMTILPVVTDQTFTTTYIATSSGTPSGEVNDWGYYALWNNQSLCSGLQGARIIQHTVDDIVTTYVFAWRQNTGLQVDFSTDVYTTSVLADSHWNTPVILDASTITCMEVIVTTNNELLVVYGRTTSWGVHEMVSLILNTDTLGAARPYRIRNGVPVKTGGLSTLDGNGSTLVVLPVSAHVNSNTAYVGDYFYAYTGYTYNTFPTSLVYNDYRLITAYDAATNTITLASALSANPNLYALSSIVLTELWLSFLSQSAFLNDSSGNGYDFTFVGFSGDPNPQYNASYTDTVGVVVNNVMYTQPPFNIPWGMWRDVSSDTALQDIFTWNYVYEFTPFTTSIWFSTDLTSPIQQTLFSFTGPVSVPIITRAYINYPARHLIVELPSNTSGGILAYDIGLVNANTWYHLVISCGSTPHSCNIYLNRERVEENVEGSSFIGFLQYMAVGFRITDVDTGEPLGDTPFKGYIKDFFITAATYTQLQVDNAYYATLVRGYYTLNWSILGDVSDYFNPLNYSSSTLTTAQPVCYEMELTCLTLPNVVLSTGFGNRIAFYPYVYVEFTSLNRNANNSIYSNNPAAEKVLFKVPIQTTASPLIANFVNNGAYMHQIVKFQPNDNFHFAVKMFNGELFETALLDTLPPLPPNPLLQVSATIGFKAVYK